MGSSRSSAADLIDDVVDDQANPQTNTPKGNFFAVDLRVWRRVIQLGINTAITFLVLARGSGGDNVTTSWSTDAVERYTGISRHKAKAAIELLEKIGVLELVRAGTKPQRRIKAAHEILGCAAHFGPLSSEEQAFLAKLPFQVVTMTPPEHRYIFSFMVDPEDVDEDGQPCWTAEEKEIWNRGQKLNLDGDELKTANSLAWKGYALWDRPKNGLNTLLPREVRPEIDYVPDWIWLPNALVDGVSGEVPPLELIRQTRRLEVLSTFVELYHEHSLIRFGGIDTQLYHRTCDSHVFGQARGHRVWGFNGDILGIACALNVPMKNPHLPLFEDWGEGEPTYEIDGEEHVERTGWRLYGRVALMEAMERLEEIGLIDHVFCLFDGPGEEAEILYPLPLPQCTVATPAELNLAQAAYDACCRLMPGQRFDPRDAPEWTFGKKAFSWNVLVPVSNHMTRVELRGVLRLRYRPHTMATAQWMAESERWEEEAARMEKLAN